MAVFQRGALAGVFLALALVSTAYGDVSPNSSAYRILVGDVLQVDVTGRADISGQYTVDKDGGIKLPVIGGVAVEGRTANELGTEISRRISLISRDIPQVTVSVVEAYRRKNFVLGAVLLPGSFSFSKAPTVWEAISEAGGPTEDADLTVVQVISESQATPTIVNLAAAVRAGDLASLPRLRPGDTVRVPRTTGGSKGLSADVIYIFGAVNAQGSQPLTAAPDLVEALIRSNPTAEANLDQVEIVRKTGGHVVSMKVNMRDYLGSASLVGNPELQPGDTIYITRKKSNTNYFQVLGLVLGFATSIAVLTHYNH